MLHDGLDHWKYLDNFNFASPYWIGYTCDSENGER